MATSTPEEILKDIFSSALKAVDPYAAVKGRISAVQDRIQETRPERIVVAGFGKAACPMAKAVEDSLQDCIVEGIVITKYGHCEKSGPQKIRICEGGHPVPDENGLMATQDLVELLRRADEKTLVVCLISGGGSALLVSPCAGVSLAEKQKVTDLLLKAGADIFELNSVRKHLSDVKGGRLAEIASPSRVVSLLISDVIGDPLDVIASGPTAPDPSSYRDALRVLERYGLMESAPRAVIDHLHRGDRGLLPETPKQGNPIFGKVENIIAAGNRQAIEEARSRAASLGLQAEVISREVSGEAGEAAKKLAHEAIRRKNLRDSGSPLCLISGGETTVHVTGNGLGGRNTEFALAFAREVRDIDGITCISAGTDGTDGPTDAAGAIVNGRTVYEAAAKGLDPEAYLENNDSYTFFKAAGGLFITGPTGTNVMDLQIILVE